MQPLYKDDVFTGIDAQTLHEDSWIPDSESSFETARGLLTAAALGLPLWAAIILCCWIWM